MISVDADLVLDAIELSEACRLSFRDAAPAAAARAAGASTLFSEDLGDGQLLAGVRIRNPFAAAAR